MAWGLGFGVWDWVAGCFDGGFRGLGVVLLGVFVRSWV